MTKAQIIDKYIQRIMVDYPEDDKIHIDLVQFAEELRQCNVSGSLPSDELEKSLGNNNMQYTIWHDGGEWLISLKGKEREQCKTLKEWLGGNDR